MGAGAHLIERLDKLSSGTIKGTVDGVKVDMIGDPEPLRKILPRPLLPFRQAVERVLVTRDAPRASA